MDGRISSSNSSPSDLMISQFLLHSALFDDDEEDDDDYDDNDDDDDDDDDDDEEEDVYEHDNLAWPLDTQTHPLSKTAPLTGTSSMSTRKIFDLSRKSRFIDIHCKSIGIVITKSTVLTPEKVAQLEHSQNFTLNVSQSKTVPQTLTFNSTMSPEWNYFEIQILEEGEFCEIGIGVGPSDYHHYAMPGWIMGSIGYHADDGNLFYGSGTALGYQFAPECVLDDSMGCGVDFSSQKHGYVSVWFTRNGELAGPPEKFPLPKDGLYPLIGMSTLNESVLYTGHSCVPPPYSEVPADPTEMRVFPKCITVKAVYPYEAQLPDELTLSPGDVVEVTDWDFESKPKWAKGRALEKDEEGLFFTGFVQPVLTEETKKTKDTQDYTNTYRGRQYVFAEKPEEWLECLICREIATDPHQSSCCGHTLCLRCATKWKERSDSCVNCRREPFEFQKDPRAERLVTGLEVSCVNSRYGCKWKGSLSRVDSHLETKCNFGYLNQEFTPDSIVDCPCCARSVVDEATQQKIFCGRMKYSVLIETHYCSCPDWPMRCPNGCPDPLTRASLPVHLGVDCPEEIVSCDYSPMGCPVQMKQKEMKKHLDRDVVQHLSMLLSNCTKVNEQQKAQLDEVKSENAKLREQQQILSAKFADMKAMNAKLCEQQNELSAEVDELKKENVRMGQKVDELSKRRRFF